MYFQILANLQKFLKIQLQHDEHCYKDALNSFTKKRISEAIYNSLYPKYEHLAGASGLSNVHKNFDITYFWPIIDNAVTTHYFVGKYLSELLSSLIHNRFLPFFTTYHRFLLHN